jgi:pimeloyl-ACP methyl ester carboxylesterase
VSPSVVCLHGLRRTPADWDGVRPGLEPYGEVSTPSLPPRPADALARADAEVSPGDVVIGHSMGGVVALRLAEERPRQLAALVLSGCFFPPARNGRGLGLTIADYAGHRLAFVRELARGEGGGERSEGSARALAGLVRQAASRRGRAATASVTAPPVLVVHARDDHHVPVDFALAAAARDPGWTIHLLDRGGHHAHVRDPAAWLEAVTPWLERTLG